MVFECEMCERQLFQITAFDGRKCNNFTPIPLTCCEAKKWRDWAVEKFGVNTLRDALADVVCTLTKLEPVGREKQRQYACTYLAIHAQPYHYILAAVLCEYRSWPRLFFDGEGCNHKGCQNHISHPCEECGRTAAKGEIRSKGDN